MKNIIIFLFFSTFYNNAFSQNILNEGNRAEDFIYCELVGESKWMSRKIQVEIDFGQGLYRDQRIRDEETGKVKKFMSMIDAMNYMGDRGWEFIQAYAITYNNQNVYHYILKRPKKGSGYIPDTK
jgi:hypothetical protein